MRLSLPGSPQSRFKRSRSIHSNRWRRCSLCTMRASSAQSERYEIQNWTVNEKPMTLSIDLARIIESDHEHLIHPLFHPNDQKDPFVWVQGRGAMLRAADGREFIDGLSCLWNVNVGHGRKEL